jgi:hypothetical protein
LSRDGEASPVGAAEVFALNGVLRVHGSLVLSLLVLVFVLPLLVLELLLEVVPAPREVDPFVLQVAGVPSPVPAIAGPFVEEPDLHCLLVPRRVLKQLPLPSSSQVVAKGREDGKKKSDDAFGLRRRDDKFLVEPALKDVEGETRLLPRCFWHGLQLALGAVERSFDL